MADTKSSGKLLLYGLVLVLLLFGLVEIMVSAKGLFLHLELAGFLSLLLLSSLGLAGYRSYGEKCLFLVFLLYIGNLVLIWHFFDRLYFVLLLISLVGLLMSFPQKRKEKKREFANPVTNEPASVVFDNTPKVEIVHDEPKKEKETNKAQHSPGKYLASQRSNIYHEPKCDWAKKIKKDRQLWFPDKKDAQKKGYRKHSCVN